MFYLTCTEPTGEMAQDCFNQEFDQVMNATVKNYLPKIYKVLKNELKRRKENILEGIIK